MWMCSSSILYELLAGRRPFQGNAMELFKQIISVPPVPPRDLDLNIPVKLERSLVKTMAKRPSDRYSSAAEMADDLNDWQTNSVWRWL